MPKMPFFLQLNMLGTITFFEKSVYAFKNNKILRSIESIVSFSSFYIFWI